MDKQPSAIQPLSPGTFDAVCPYNGYNGLIIIYQNDVTATCRRCGTEFELTDTYIGQPV